MYKTLHLRDQQTKFKADTFLACIAPAAICYRASKKIIKHINGPEFGAMTSMTGPPVSSRVGLTDDATEGIGASPLSWSSVMLSNPNLSKIAPIVIMVSH